jgi:hypothetical protein
MNDQQTVTAELPIAIVHRVTTLSITFVEKPTDSQRQQLKDHGYRYENGKWYKSQPEGYHADAELISQILAA